MTEKQKTRIYEKRRTKRELLSKIIRTPNDDEIIITSKKRKISLSINHDILNLIERTCDNKSELIEKLLKELLEKELKKHIIITKDKG